MGDWYIEGNVRIVSPGYNSNYCVELSQHGWGYSKFTNVAYESDAFMVVGFMKYYIDIDGRVIVGHSAYGSIVVDELSGVPRSRDISWFKFRFVTYYNNNIGYAVLTIEKWDENSGSWSPLKTVRSSVTEPTSGKIYFQVTSSDTEYGAGTANLYLDNLELYTGKSLYISKIVSEAIEKVISKS